MSERNQVELPPVAAVLAALLDSWDQIRDVSAPHPEPTKEQLLEAVLEVAPGYPRRMFDMAWNKFLVDRAEESDDLRGT